jgi:hypothetical protein
MYVRLTQERRTSIIFTDRRHEKLVCIPCEVFIVHSYFIIQSDRIISYKINCSNGDSIIFSKLFQEILL